MAWRLATPVTPVTAETAQIDARDRLTAAWYAPRAMTTRAAWRMAGEPGRPAIQSKAMPERRYGDDEVREIFRIATTEGGAERVLPSESGGLTLTQLQHAGEEAGISASRVARAAAQLDARGSAEPTRTSFGLPVGFRRVVKLPRAPTEREWERLISEFRNTFGVQGVASSSGGMRQWSNGNLHISLEPTAHGEQLRISTLNESVIGLNGLGAVVGGFSLLMGAVVTAAGKPEKAFVLVGILGGFSLAALASNVVRARRWARARQQQLTDLSDHAGRLLSGPQP